MLTNVTEAKLCTLLTLLLPQERRMTSLAECFRITYDRMLDSAFVSIPVWSRRLEITVAALVNISLGYLLEGTGGTNSLVVKLLIWKDVGLDAILSILNARVRIWPVWA